MGNPPDLSVSHHSTGSKGEFFIERNGVHLAELTYTVAGNITILDHTHVDDALRGTGAGRRLVDAAVQWARQGGHKFLPLCPFAKSVFDKTPEYADVLKH